MCQEIKNKLKSPVVQTSLVSLLFFILKTYGLFTPFGLTPESYNELTALIIALINSLAAMNNPNTPDKF